jgi:hypothetical protein
MSPAALSWQSASAGAKYHEPPALDARWRVGTVFNTHLKPYVETIPVKGKRF